MKCHKERLRGSSDPVVARMIARTIVFSLVSLCLACCSRVGQQDPRLNTNLVSIEGSDTMSVLLEAWREEFVKSTSIPVSVSVADTGKGIRALINRTTDIAAASRGLTDAERRIVHERKIHLDRKLVALDAIAIIVNKDCTLNSITMNQLSDLYRGKIKLWSEVDNEITGKPMLLVREPNSGTARYFQEHVLVEPSKDVDPGPSPAYSTTAKVVTSNEDMIARVVAEPSAIGYVGLSHAISAQDSIKILKLKLMPASPSVMPSQNATTSDYPLSRPLYLFLDKSAKQTTRQFVDFCLGPKGQELVVEQGYVSINTSS